MKSEEKKGENSKPSIEKTLKKKTSSPSNLGRVTLLERGKPPDCESTKEKISFSSNGYSITQA